MTSDLRLAASSRYVQRCLPWPRVYSSQKQAEYLLEIAGHHHLEGWMLFAGSDASAELLGRHHEILDPIFRISTSPLEAIHDALDKRRSYALADRAGVAHPRTWYPQNAIEMSHLDISYPAILKPAVKRGWNAFIRAKAWKVRNRDELMCRYREALTMVDAQWIMVQDLIPGANHNQFSYAALCRDGMPIASLVARRLRQYPVDFGRASSLVETIDLSEVEEQARRLLNAMSFTGLVEVEFKRDPRDGKLKLLDINPRVWRWISLGHRAGVDFPYLMYRLARGEHIDAVRGRAGARWIRLSTDLLAAARGLWDGSITLRDYRDSLRAPIEFSILAADDVFPALMEMPHVMASDFRRSRFYQRFQRRAQA